MSVWLSAVGNPRAQLDVQLRLQLLDLPPAAAEAVRETAVHVVQDQATRSTNSGELYISVI